MYMYLFHNHSLIVTILNYEYIILRILRIQGFLHYEMLVDNHLQVTTYGTDKDRFALHAVLHTISINCIENTLCDYIYK